jgi:hypothetical protein
MDPRTLWRPTGRLPARVYWTRRLMVLAVLAVLAAVIAVSVGGGGSHRRGSAAGAPTPSPTPTATETSAAPTPPLRCRHRDLEVTAATDQTTYPAGVEPRLSAVVRNVSAQPCRFVTSTAKRIWTITSGTDRVWSSADCTGSDTPGHERLKPGKTITYALVWNRHRSARGCPTATPAADPGTYLLDVAVNGVRSATVVFHLAD